MPAKPNSFPKILHVTGRPAFQAAYERGVRETAGPFVAVYGKAADIAQPMRLGISAPRKAGNAVERNRVKRQLREAFRTMKSAHTSGVDLVILIRAHKPLAVSAVRGHVERILQRVSMRSAKGDLPLLNPTSVEPPPPPVQ